MAHTTLDARPDLHIPVIDLGPFLAGAPGAAAAAARAIGEASETLGFYFIGNHGIAQGLIDDVFVQAQRFHTMPEADKLAVRAIGKVVGYLPRGGQTQYNDRFGKSAHPDTSASYYIRRELPPDHPDRRTDPGLVLDNKWPADLPGFRDTCLRYYDEMSALGERMLELHALALGLEAEYLRAHPAFQPSHNTLRLLHYPSREVTLDGQFGIGPHTDYGYCTYLAQEKTPGLEILTRAGDWIEAPALAGHFLVNNADMCRRWTNDRWRSAPHRVINKSGAARLSIPFFFGPRPNVRLACLPSCMDAANPAKYEPLSFGEYLAEIGPKNYTLPAG